MSWKTSTRAGALMALALLPLAAGADPARAATAGLSAGELRYSAAPGELNRIAVTYSWADYSFTIRDAAGVEITPGPGCLQGTLPNEVVCDDPGSDPVLRAGDGDDTISVSDVGAELYGDEGADTLSGGPHNDLLDGGAGADAIAGGSGYDRLDYSLRAAPLLFTPDGLDPDDGEAGEGDRVAADVEHVLGGSAHDDLAATATGGRLEGREGDDELRGGAGLDRLYGGDGSDDARGGWGADTLDGGAGDDGLGGGEGGDSLYGSAGDDELAGGDGIDRISDGPGNDLVNGEGGDDRLIAGSGADSMHGGPGNDYVDYAARFASLAITIGGTAGELGEGDLLDPDVEGARGGSGADTMTGSGAGDYLAGHGGNDVIDGLGGSDAIYAGSGNDRVSARDGAADRIACGYGSDVVQADSSDVVQADCESIQRPLATPVVPTPPAPPPAPSPAPAPVTPTLAAPRPIVAPARAKPKPPRAPDTTPPIVTVPRAVVPGPGHANVPVRVGCPEGELDGCSGYVTLYARSGGRRVKVGASSYNVFGGRRALVRVGLTKAGRAQARARRRIEAVVSARDGAGNSHRVRVNLRLPRA